MAKGKSRRVTNPTKVVPIVLNEEQMYLKYNMYAIEKLNDIGVDITKINEDDGTVKSTTIISILWAGLLTYDTEITRDEVAMLVDFDQLQYVADKIMLALNSKKAVEPKN